MYQTLEVVESYPCYPACLKGVIALHPILFHIGHFPVRAYSVAIMTAVLAGACFAAWLGGKRGVSWADKYIDFATWGMVGGILGARLWEVAFNWSYYRNELPEILAIWEGGLSIQGAILGGLIAAWIYTRRHGIPVGGFLDESVPALLLGQAIGRLLGCTLNGDAYGRPTETWFGIVHAPGTNAHMAYGAQRLWPAEVFEGVFDLVLMVIMLRLAGSQKGPAGSRFLLYATLYSSGRFALEFLRGDTDPVLAWLTAAQVGSLAVILLSACVRLWQGRTFAQQQHREL